MTATVAPLSWGRYPRLPHTLISVDDRSKPLPKTEAQMLPYGNGRSYGDSCLNGDGVLLQARGLDRFIRFDPVEGRIACEAGVLLAEILEVVIPAGWFLPVTPGTKFVTVGGAIANDVHGKNHHRVGTFGCHVLEFELLRSDGTRLTCSRTENAGWFGATIGGLGLTGLITWADLQLKRIDSVWIDRESVQFFGLDSFFDWSTASDRDYEYTVAWVDCASSGKALGRGIFFRGNHARKDSPPARPRGKKLLGLPLTPPVSLVNNATVRVFNALYYRRAKAVPSASRQHYDAFFYPLDRIDAWNRIYGPKGLLQYQCVVPLADARAVLREALLRIGSAGTGSFLAVLKLFGAQSSPGIMSFPRPGATLALDFPNHGTDVFRLLDELDGLVSEAGGAVYPAKDARMAATRFRRYFPRWEEFSNFVDPRFSSSLWRRVAA